MSFFQFLLLRYQRSFLLLQAIQFSHIQRIGMERDASWMDPKATINTATKNAMGPALPLLDAFLRDFELIAMKIPAAFDEEHDGHSTSAHIRCALRSLGDVLSCRP